MRSAGLAKNSTKRRADWQRAARRATIDAVSEPAPTIAPEVAALIEGGIAIVVATRDADMRPQITRAWGASVTDDGAALTLCVAAAEGSRTLDNLRANGAIAVTFSSPTTYRTVQAKGVVTDLRRQPSARDLARRDEHIEDLLGPGRAGRHRARGRPPPHPRRGRRRDDRRARALPPDPRSRGRDPAVSPRAVPLESIRACLAGVIPSPLATCAADGTPNISYMSIVKYVDPERIALSRQFLNKTRANLDVNPVAQVLLVDPGTCDGYLLDLRHVHTETDGPVFEAMRTELEAIASQSGMGDVFRLRGVDIYHVVRCEAVHEEDGRLRPGAAGARPHRPARRADAAPRARRQLRRRRHDGAAFARGPLRLPARDPARRRRARRPPLRRREQRLPALRRRSRGGGRRRPDRDRGRAPSRRVGREPRPQPHDERRRARQRRARRRGDRREGDPAARPRPRAERVGGPARRARPADRAAVPRERADRLLRAAQRAAAADRGRPPRRGALGARGRQP